MISVVVEVSRTIAGIEAKMAGVDEAAKQAAQKMAHAVEAETKTLLGAKRHSAKTKTPSAPGEPPAQITGTLRASITSTDAERRGFGDYRAQVGPTVVYGRVQELGGNTGRTTLPARPYLSTALRNLRDSGELARIYNTEIAKGLKA